MTYVNVVYLDCLTLLKYLIICKGKTVKVETFSGASKHELLNIQNHKLEAKTLRSANLGSSSTPRSKKDHFEDTKLKPTRASLDDDEPPPKGETQRLLDEAEQEVLNLMNKDYSSPKWFPGKPPITSDGIPKH
ncbi:uncharacterized protein LOC119993484 [Tripterygium wilfordii]|uniref:uncharacterized protein LOC119993484 n=1 Tax=Tripterygium wilfordii TaxID=458696 RepID=UPI0018F85696|nr:uncharacterized protein LOC119993484 [Tripterygium wilfordii]